MSDAENKQALTYTYVSITVVALLMALAISGIQADQVNYTVAKNLNAKMSSLYDPRDNPILGNDGNTSGVYYTGAMCVHFNTIDLQPWWMLDMLTVRLISSVRVWNRIDCCWSKFNNVTIGISTFDSVWSNFSLSLFDVCYFHTWNTISAQNPLDFNCYQPVAGRYLTVYRDALGVVQNESLMWYFHFCEVDIFAFTKAQPYKFKTVEPSFSDFAAAPLTDIAQVLTPTAAARSMVECIWQCGNHPSCLYTLYSNGQCYRFPSVVIPSSFRNASKSTGAIFSGFFG